MRISTSTLFSVGTAGILDRQSDLLKTQNQLSTGRRVLTPADDPIAAAETLKVSQAQGVNTQLLDNLNTAQSSLSFLETTLGSVSSELGEIVGRATEGGNPTLSPLQRGLVATELKVRLQNLISLANTQDGNGLYIFAGNSTATKPFQLNDGLTPPYTGSSPPYSLGVSTLVGYFGDSGQQSLLVTQSTEIAISDNGYDVFLQVKDTSGKVIGRSVFDSLQNIIDQLDPASGLPRDDNAYKQALGDLNDAISHIASVRASVGARQNGVDSLILAAQDKDLQYNTRLSDLQNLDYAEAISRFTYQKVQLDAAQTSFKQINELSLFNQI